MSEELILFKGESPANYEQKCLCVLVLDVSGSMAGDPILELNEGLRAFREAVMQDFIAAQRLEVAIFTFGGEVRCLQEPSLIDGLAMPVLHASGSTPMADAMRKALFYVEERKKYYRATGQTYYRPIVVLMTDGEPDSDQDMTGAAREIREGDAANKFILFSVGVAGYNHAKLAALAPTNRPPLPLKGLQFSEFFKWLSRSVQIVSRSQEGEALNLPDVSGWTQIKI